MFNYSIYRKDRTQETSIHARGGGVLIAVTKDIKSKVIQSSSFYEFLFVPAGQDINLVILAAAYFPPKSPIAAYVAFNEEVDRICEEFSTAHLCILGDFNLPHSA
ncbi:hypothetical protein JTB14_025138 [Gonioctena quinquepunctata]|nr:hypothetical protein JTB14_025138 [Gonioctena quinquepunctata]